MKRIKEVVLAYKIKPNLDNKTSYVEFVGVTDNWKDREFFMVTCEITHFTPFFLHLPIKE